MVSRPLRLGVLGGGTMAAVHLAGLTGSRRAKVALVASLETTPRVERLAQQLEADVVGVDELLADDTLDAVIVATPTDTHAELVCRALETGADVLCEKPLARTPAEGDRVAEAARRRDAKVAVGHVVRYFPEYEAARDEVVSGRLGTIATARLVRLNSSPAALRPWYGELARSGGCLLDMAIHDLDWCLWALGPVRRVYARRSGATGREVASIVCRHVAGTISTVEVSWHDDAFETAIEVCGTDGLYRAEGSMDAGLSLGGDPAELSYVPEGGPTDDDPYVRELAAALDWFAGGPPPRAVLEDGLAALTLAAAAELSAATGEPVEVAP